MTPLRSRRWMMVLFALASLAASTACLTLAPRATTGTPTSAVGNTTSAADTPASPASTQPAVAGTPSVAASAEPAGTSTPLALVSTTEQGNVSVSVPGDVAYGPGAFSLVDSTAGLADLSSYTATLKITFDGQQDGQAQQWSTTYVMRSAQPPAARQLTIEKTGDNPDLDPVFQAELNGAAYTQRGTGACTATAIDPENALGQQMEPAGFLTGVIGAQAAGSDTVNGLGVDHYTFDERALGQLGLATATGELWVASTGGYLVKYTLTTKGDAAYFGDGMEGTLTQDYELTGANQPVTIQLPPGCPAGLVDAPQLPDAAHVQSLPGRLTYDTATSLADAAAFYQQQLPGLGWTADGDPAITDTLAALDYAQGGQTLSVILTTGASGTRVEMVLDNTQP